MDKVNGSNSQAMPLWDRQKSGRGHHSSVDGALRAHRARNAERESRVQERLSLVRGMQSQFFPTANVAQRPSLMEDSIQSQNLQQAPVVTQNQLQVPQIQNEIVEVPQMKAFDPIEMDQIYSEASLGNANDSAFGIVQKELSNPEEGPVEDMPKGSYVDYTV